MCVVVCLIWSLSLFLRSLSSFFFFFYSPFSYFCLFGLLFPSSLTSSCLSSFPFLSFLFYVSSHRLLFFNFFFFFLTCLLLFFISLHVSPRCFPYVSCVLVVSLLLLSRLFFFFCLLVSCGSLFLFHILFISISLSSSLSPLLSCDWQLLQVLNFNESQSGAPLGDGISSFAIFSMLELFLSCVTSFSRDCVWWREGERERGTQSERGRGKKKNEGELQWSHVRRAESWRLVPVLLPSSCSSSPSLPPSALARSPSLRRRAGVWN